MRRSASGNGLPSAGLNGEGMEGEEESDALLLGEETNVSDSGVEVMAKEDAESFADVGAENLVDP